MKIQDALGLPLVVARITVTAAPGSVLIDVEQYTPQAARLLVDKATAQGPWAISTPVFEYGKDAQHLWKPLKHRDDGTHWWVVVDKFSTVGLHEAATGTTDGIEAGSGAGLTAKFSLVDVPIRPWWYWAHLLVTTTQGTLGARCPAGSTSKCYLIAAGQSPGVEHTIQVDVRSEGSTNAFQAAGPMVVRDASTSVTSNTTSNPSMRGYICQATSSTLEIVERSGTTQSVRASTSLSHSRNTWYTLNLTMSWNDATGEMHITCTDVGRATIEFTDTTPSITPLLPGWPGIQQGRSTGPTADGYARNPEFSRDTASDPVYYQPVLDVVSRVVGPSSETSTYDKTASRAVSDLRIHVPLSTLATTIATVENLVTSTFLTEAQSLEAVVAGTYYFDPAGPFAIIGHGAASAGASVKYQVSASVGAAFDLTVPRFVLSGSPLYCQGLITTPDGNPAIGFISHTELQQDGVRVAGGPRYNLADGNYFTILDTSLVPPGDYNVVIWFTDTTTDATFKKSFPVAIGHPGQYYTAADIHFGFFDARTARGLSFHDFKLYAGSSAGLDESDRVTSTIAGTVSNRTLYYEVRDHFDNEVATGNVFVDRPRMWLDVPLDVSQFKLGNVNASTVLATFRLGEIELKQWILSGNIVTLDVGDGAYNLTLDFYDSDTGEFIKTVWAEVTIAGEPVYYKILGEGIVEVVVPVDDIATAVVDATSPLHDETVRQVGDLRLTTQRLQEDLTSRQSPTFSPTEPVSLAVLLRGTTEQVRHLLPDSPVQSALGLIFVLFAAATVNEAWKAHVTRRERFIGPDGVVRVGPRRTEANQEVRDEHGRRLRPFVTRLSGVTAALLVVYLLAHQNGL